MGLNLCLSGSLNASRMTEGLIISLHPARPATCCTMCSENLNDAITILELLLTSASFPSLSRVASSAVFLQNLATFEVLLWVKLVLSVSLAWADLFCVEIV